MLEVVPFEAWIYGEEVAAVFAMHGEDQAEMPLTRSGCASAAARDALAGKPARELFPHSPTPDAALCGLYLYIGCWDEAHRHADAAESRENHYWHGIVHRQEPDAWNAEYWFRRTGAHPIFARLREAAGDAGYPVGPAWDPFGFVRYCEAARGLAGSKDERLARQVQYLEWQLLFDYSARGARH